MRVRYVSEIPRPRGLSRVERLGRLGALAALRHEGVRAEQDLNVVWASRPRVRALNRRFRGKNRFTDVIAFRYEESDFPIERTPVFGDLYIAIGQGRLNARVFGVSLEEELVRLVVHGTLHLLGYTDYVPKEKQKMWAVQEKILARILKKN